MADFNWSPTGAPTMMGGGRTDDIWFSDENVGWAVNSNGQILATQDAGATWQEQARYPTSYLRCVSFSSPSIGWVGTVTSNNRLLRTRDGGTTWTPVAALPAQPSAICGLCAVDDSTVYASGTNWPDRPAGILKSADGGASWLFIDMSAHASLLVDIFFTSVDRGWVVGGFGGKRRDLVRAVVLYTEDGGATWTNQLAQQSGTLPLGEWGWKIQFLNPRTGFVSLENFAAGAILRTDDGGGTWVRLPVNDPQGNANLEGIGFVTLQSGWVGGWGDKSFKGGFTSSTSDGGKTWQNANQVGKFLNRFRLVGDPLKVAYASGDTVYRYAREAAPPVAHLAGRERSVPTLFDAKLSELSHGELRVQVNVPPGAKRLDANVWDRFGAHVATLADEDMPATGLRTLSAQLFPIDTQAASHYIYRVSTEAFGESEVIPAPRTQAGDDVVQALRERLAAGKPGAVLPLPSADEEREAFFRIANIETNPDFRPIALALAHAYLANADYSASDLFAPFDFSEKAFEDRMRSIYEADLPGMRSPHRYDLDVIEWSNGKRYRIGRASDAVARDRLLQMAPFNLLDGAWLQSVAKARPVDEVQSRLFSIWSDEAGNGNAEHNHSNIYRDLLRSQGIYLPEINERQFIEIDVAPGAWRSPVFQMGVGLFPEQFLPEILGMTLYLEWEATPTLYPIGVMFRNRGINPLFYLMHAAIDNISKGHGALAKEAIQIFLNDKKQEGGDAAVQCNWSRIWNGYVTWATAGSNGEGMEERRLLIDRVSINLGTADEPVCFPDYRLYHAERMKKLIREKAAVARQVHGNASLGGAKLNDLFDQPEELMRRLVDTKLVDPAHPRQSRFFGLTSFGGPMYQVFTGEEKSIILDWLESMTSAPSCIDPLPDTLEPVSWPDRMASMIEALAGRARRAHDKLSLPGGDGSRIPLVELFDRPRDLMAALVRGGWVVPGDPDASLFLTRVIQNDGPMGGVLGDDDIASITKWIESGAKTGGDATALLTTTATFALNLDTRTERALSRQTVRAFVGQGAVH